MSDTATSAILSQLLRRLRAGRSSIVIVVHAGDRPPADLLTRVEAALYAEGIEAERVEWSELAPNPVQRLVELRSALGVEVFSVTCDADRLAEDDGVTVNALNLHRDSFVRYRLSAIFWIPSRGMPVFARHASNFLDFRTDYVEVDSESEIVTGEPRPLERRSA